MEVCQIPEVGKRLESQIFEAFMSFAKTGKPESDKLPVWESVTGEKEPTMILTENVNFAMILTISYMRK